MWSSLAHTTQLVLITGNLLLFASARADELAKKSEPPFVVQVTASSFRGLDRVEVSVHGQTKKTWRCVLHDDRQRER